MVRGIGRGNDPQLPGLEYRPSIAQLLAPEAAGVNPHDYDDITDYSIAEVSQLRGGLIDVDWWKSVSALSHQPYPRGPHIGIAVNPEDYSLVARSAEHLGKAVVARTLERYPKEERYDPVKRAAAKRSGVHAVEGKLGGIDWRLGEINHQRELLETLSEMSEGKNYNLRRSYEAREQFHELMSSVVANMVDAAGIERGYDPGEMALLRGTIEKRLYVWPENVGPRVHYFNGLANLGVEYFGHLVMIYARSRFETRKYIHEHSE